VAQSTDGTLRLYVGGKDDGAASLLRAWGRRCGLDGEIAFTSKVRARRTFGPGKRATIWAPTVYYRNPQGSVAGALACSVSFVKNYNEETLTQSFTMDTTQDDNGITIKEQKLESLACADVAVLDAVISMTWTPTVAGTGWDSVVTPTIDAMVTPLKVQERV
jgi:hypothetical protein